MARVEIVCHWSDECA